VKRERKGQRSRTNGERRCVKGGFELTVPHLFGPSTLFLGLQHNPSSFASLPIALQNSLVHPEVDTVENNELVVEAEFGSKSGEVPGA